MTREEFSLLVKHPEKVMSEHAAGLKEIVGLYPAFSQARVLLAKALQLSDSVGFDAGLKMAALYSTNRRWLYYYMYPDQKLSTEQYKREHAGKSSGDYFDMIDTVARDGGDARQSLRNLAERLKSARALVTSQPAKPASKERPAMQPVVLPITDVQPELQVVRRKAVPEEKPELPRPEISEDMAKKYIRERKYKEALAILKDLNLNNPKKSIYFADQIRFLEKVISNSKK